MRLVEQIKFRLSLLLGLKSYIKLAKCYNNILVQIRQLNKDSREPRAVALAESFIYISQPPRCGGTLLRNLFDGHSELATYPYELSWEKNEYFFTHDIETNESTYNRLVDTWLSHAINHGVDKRKSLEFDFSFRLFKRLFVKQDSRNTRRVLDTYFQSFYASWNNCNFSTNPKFNLAFCPWDRIRKEWVENFFEVYPCGYRIHIVRDPRAWWLSEKTYTNYEEKNIIEYTEGRWEYSTKEGLFLAEKYPDNYILVNYENLVLNPAQTMKILCDKIGLKYESILTIPTFNKIPRRSNSSTGKLSTGVITDSLELWKQRLSYGELNYLEGSPLFLYEKAKAKCVNN